MTLALAAMALLAVGYLTGRSRPWLLIRDTARSCALHAERGRTNPAVLVLALAINADRVASAYWRHRSAPLPARRPAPNLRTHDGLPPVDKPNFPQVEDTP